jgi:hypothetical protein
MNPPLVPGFSDGSDSGGSGSDLSGEEDNVVDVEPGPKFELPRGADMAKVFRTYRREHKEQCKADELISNALKKLDQVMLARHTTLNIESIPGATKAIKTAREHYKVLQKARRAKKQKNLLRCIISIDKAKEFPHIAMYATDARVCYDLMDSKDRNSIALMYAPKPTNAQ